MQPFIGVSTLELALNPDIQLFYELEALCWS